MKLHFGILILCFCITFQAPVSCVTTAKVLELDSNLSTGCDHKTTCEHVCPCQRRAYFDLKPLFSANLKSKKYWQKVCPQTTTVRTWLTNEINIGVENLKGRKLFRKIRRKASSEILGKFLKLFDGVYARYESICSGGKKLTDSDIPILAKVLENGLKKRYFTFKALFVRVKRVKKEARRIFNTFVQKYKNHSFDYCSCEKFGSILTDEPEYDVLVKQKCETLC
eukprot:gene5614-9431_t